MKPAPIISTLPTSERRAAAARANGAKSRGPVTAFGRANSSRNSIAQNGGPVRPCPRNAETPGSTSGQHGLRSRTLFADPESAGQLTALLASFERTLQPQSEIERTLIGTMALARSRQTCLWKLETSEINRKVRRLTSLTPEENPVTLIALAFGALSGDGCSLDLIGRLESRCDRQFDRAYNRLTAHQARRARFSEKVKTSERSQQTTENTESHFTATQQTSPSELRAGQSQSSENPNLKKVIISERTQQAAENTTPPLGTTRQTGASRIEPELKMQAGH
jgi:hypothetical protein